MADKNCSNIGDRPPELVILKIGENYSPAKSRFLAAKMPLRRYY